MNYFRNKGRARLKGLLPITLLTITQLAVAQADLLVADSVHNSIKRFDGVTGAYKSDFVTAGSGGLSAPFGITYGSDGSLYVASDPTRQILKYNGQTGAFVGVFATLPSVNNPGHIAFGPDGNMYVSEWNGKSVWRFNGTTGASLGVFATNANLDQPDGLAWRGNELFISNSGHGRVARADATTGAWLGGYAGFEGSLLNPTELNFLGDGSLLVTAFGNNSIRKYDPTGVFVSTFATSSDLDGPVGTLVGSDGNLYVSSFNNSKILRYNGTTGAYMGVFAQGSGLLNPNNMTFMPVPEPGFWAILAIASALFVFERRNRRLKKSALVATGVVACSMSFANPGNLLVSGRGSNNIVEFDAATGNFVKVFASGGLLNNPVGMAIGNDGNVYVSNGLGLNVLKYDANGNSLGVFASGGGLGEPRDLTFGPDGNLYVASGTTRQIIKYDGTTGASMGVFATTGLNGPVGLTFGPNNDLFVSSALNNRVIRFNGTTGASLGIFASGGGLSNPTDLLFRPDGNLYVLSAVSNQVLRYQASTGAFVDVFAQGGGLNIGLGMLFDSVGDILVGSNQSNQILNYSGATGAFQQVFASNASLQNPNGMTYLPVPEPATVLSLATLSICLIRRRKKSKI